MVRWWYDLGSRTGAPLSCESGMNPALFTALSGSFSACGQIFRTPDLGLLTDGKTEPGLKDFATNTVVMMLAGGPDFPIPADTPDPHPASTVDACRLVALPRTSQPGQGSCSWVDNDDSPLPFRVRRVFYLYDVPTDASRGGHSHFQAQELIVAMAGSFDVIVDDGRHLPRRFTLNRQ